MNEYDFFLRMKDVRNRIFVQGRNFGKKQRMVLENIAQGQILTKQDDSKQTKKAQG
jgi:hypothetical protein